jgi:hypothetical protein
MDAFGECRRGVSVEQHSFDQECDACADEDEGVAGMEEEIIAAQASTSRTAEWEKGKQREKQREKEVESEEEARRKRKRLRT